MLFDQDLPKFLWVEAAMIIVYIQNRSPRKSLDNTTPEEVFTGKKPSVDHVHIFEVQRISMLRKTSKRGWTRQASREYSLVIVFPQKHIEST